VRVGELPPTRHGGAADEGARYTRAMRIVDIIERKRDGGANTRAELEALVLGYTRGAVPDYQAAAWLMAVCVRGMEPDEVAVLTEIMAASGRQLDLSSVGRPVADKHSTGGVGDKTSLVVAPLVAACGVPVGKMSGRGLGFTGGTIDKLESIAGLRVELSGDDFVTQLRQEGIVLSGQSAELAPADGKLYALRDVTGTVPSIPLIAASVMSKKLAAGADAILLDVKVGNGAFMRHESEARALAETMLGIGRAAGRRVAAFVTDMSQPLGCAVGNALEVREAVETLAGPGPADLRALAVRLAAGMLVLADAAPTLEAATTRAETVLASGAGLDALRRLVRAQGGDAAYIDHPERLPHTQHVETVPAERDGWIAGLNALDVARAAMALGAGRARKGDRIDLAVGIVLRAKVGDAVERGGPLAEMHTDDAHTASHARDMITRAYRIEPSRVQPPRLVHTVLGL
jgi:pyrimidine-nucleoside phosphorylase